MSRRSLLPRGTLCRRTETHPRALRDCNVAMEADGTLFYFSSFPLQRQHATPGEIAAARGVLAESRENGDLEILAGRDTYRDLTDKVIRLYEYGLRTEARFIVKIDDDQCLAVGKVVRGLRRARGEVYGGTHMWEGRESSLMIGPHGHSSPYMGSLSFLSRGLAERIFLRDREHTVSYVINGTSSEDVSERLLYP